MVVTKGYTYVKKPEAKSAGLFNMYDLLLPSGLKYNDRVKRTATILTWAEYVNVNSCFFNVISLLYHIPVLFPISMPSIILQ